MTKDIVTLMGWIQTCLIITAICTTAFPVIYTFTAWRSARLGQAFMLQGVSFALAIDLTLLFTYWHPDDIRVQFVVNAVVFTLIAVASGWVAIMCFRLNYRSRQKKKESKTMSQSQYVPEHTAPKTPILTNKLYDYLKWIAMVLLPAVGTLYFAVAQIWHLPDPNEIVGTITVVDTFLGVVLHLSTNQYNNSDAKFDGTIDVTDQGADAPKVFSLNLDTHPDELQNQKAVTFKVNNQ